GSNNSQSFFCVRNHVNNCDLNGKGCTYTWKISCDEKYLMFRVRKMDFNYNRHYVNFYFFYFCFCYRVDAFWNFFFKKMFDFLAISEFGIYSELQEPVLQQISKCFCFFNCVEMHTGNHTKGLLLFVYSHDFDTNDACHWLGTNKGLDTWQNPALRGHTRVLYSSLTADSKHAHCVVGCELVRCVTDQKKLSWFVIDFKNIKIIPTHYSLKFRHFYLLCCITECLRNWKFEASDDNTDGVNGQWVTMITHNNDKSLNRKGAAHTWTIRYHVVMLYFLDTNGGERQCTNPVDLRLFNVDALSLMIDSAPLSALCGRALHVDDKALLKAGMTHKWHIETSHYFSRFRIFMLGRNSNIN
ncbi:hypothetical protein RFI_29432, partial [Reticulomyxa filosa]